MNDSNHNPTRFTSVVWSKLRGVKWNAEISETTVGSCFIRVWANVRNERERAKYRSLEVRKILQ